MPDKQSPCHWHAESAETVLATLETDAQGLTEAAARDRLQHHGENRLPVDRGHSWPVRFLLQFHNVLIYVLIAAAVVTALLGHWVDMGVIVGVVVINALIGVIQEGKAEKALDAIRDMLSPRATVLRGGRREQIAAEELVPGDIVLLESGDKVAADLRLIKVRELRIDEAVLTGESVPVDKSAQAVGAEVALGDRNCMAYSGTLVTYGSARGVVVATGTGTEIGRISGMLASVDTMTTPLLRQISVFGRWLAAAILAVAALTFAFAYLLRDYMLADAFMATVGLAVAAIPEGLPAIMTITLAIGVQRMARRNAIIRHLPAVETLGAVTVICSDKTGTLTRNEMTVQSVVLADSTLAVSGGGYSPEGAVEQDGVPVDADTLPRLADLARAALLCNDAVVRRQDGQWRLQGDPTEGALVTLAMKAGVDPSTAHHDYPRADAIPFESEHRFMSTLHHDHQGDAVIYLKGAPERVIEMCREQAGGNGVEPLDHDYWKRCMNDIADQGQRVLALAMKPTESGQTSLHFADVEDGLILLGLVGIIDPPRDEAIDAVAHCQAAGIRVKMITGDHARTARAIGQALGIGDGASSITGAEIEQMTDDELHALVQEADVFARASPEHKLRLVRALQQAGDVVAMTGDGVNDAPALKRADVGIAMGVKGTEVSREASAMVLADDNFASIARAVEEGRTVYDNLRKALLFLLPTNGGQAGIIIAAVLAGWVLPISPVQILWVNMVTAVTLGLALAFEPTEAGVMQRPPRPPTEQIMTPVLIGRVVLVSALLVVVTMTMFHLHHEESDVALARTLAVNTLVVCQAFYLLSARFVHESAIGRRTLRGNPWVPVSIVAILLLQLAFTYMPAMQTLFDTRPLVAVDWLLMLLAGLGVFVIVESGKWLTSPTRQHR